MAKTPTKWAILIGVNRYHESLGSLKYAVNDCHRIGDVLTQEQNGFSAEHVLLVTDDQPEERRPTYANIHAWLATWLSRPNEADTVVVYFSGHGREMDGKCYLAPGDATLQTMHVTGIPVGYVQDILARCKAKQKMLVLDACHSGAGKGVTFMSAPMLGQIAAGKGIYTITACDADELSYEWNEKKQGVFSYYLAEALSGACLPDAHGRVTAESIYEWVYDQVRSWAAKRRCMQTPKRFAEGTGAVVLGLAPKGKGYQSKPEHVVERVSHDPTAKQIPTCNTANGKRNILSFLSKINPVKHTVAFFLWVAIASFSAAILIERHYISEREKAVSDIAASGRDLREVLLHDKSLRRIDVCRFEYSLRRVAECTHADEKAEIARKYVARKLAELLVGTECAVTITNDKSRSETDAQLTGNISIYSIGDDFRVKTITLFLVRHNDGAILWSSTWNLFRMQLE